MLPSHLHSCAWSLLAIVLVCNDGLSILLLLFPPSLSLSLLNLFSRPSLFSLSPPPGHPSFLLLSLTPLIPPPLLTHNYAHPSLLHFFLSRNLTNAERQTLRVEESSSGACLVAVARLQHFGESVPRATMETNENEFVARVGVDGRFTYVDPRYHGLGDHKPHPITKPFNSQLHPKMLLEPSLYLLGLSVDLSKQQRLLQNKLQPPGRN